MEKENLTPARFADRLQINRAIISHILTGRNNPSLEVVTKILDQMPYINPEWLLKGTGSMYKEGYDAESRSDEPDLFHQTVINQIREPDSGEKTKEKTFKPSPSVVHDAEYKQPEPLKSDTRKITQIIVYYNDNTFETFGPLSGKGER